MKPKKSKAIILRGVKLLVAIAVIFVIAVATKGINKSTEQYLIKTQIQAERQTTVPIGYTGIYDVAGLKRITNNLSGKYILMQDIDMTGVEWTPIGVTSSIAFKGVFDGNLYKISNLNIDSNLQCVGMFGYAHSSTIKNITLENITVNSKYNTQVNNYACVGGLIGNNSGTVNNITITGKISYSGTLTNVSSNLSIGGIVGSNTNEGRIIDVTNKTNVEVFADAYNTRIGGVAGYNIGSIQRAENLGNVSIDTNNSAKVGGVVGYNEYYKPSIGTINNCYSIGNIVASVYNNSSSVGGLIGRNEGTINNCYSAGNIESEAFNTGGLVGYRSGGTINNCYWSVETTGQTTSNGGIAKNIQELLYQDTYETWDFDTIWSIEPEGGSLAYLRDRGMPEGILKEDLIKESEVPVAKTDENGTPLQGATFIVKNETGETLKEGITDENGVWTIRALEPGVYTVVETKAPEGHKKDTKEYSFKLTEEEKIVDVETNEEISIVVENESLKVNLGVQDSQTKQGLKEVEVGLFDEEGNVIVGSNGEHIKAKTDENGQVIFAKIPAGNYQYKQLTRAIGYHQNTNTYTFTLTEDGVVTYGEENEGIIYNDPIQANVKVTIHRKGTNKPLEGAVIGLYNEEKEPIIGANGKHITVTTGADGTAEFTGVAIGNYHYKVLTAPAGYVQDDTIYGVNVDDEGTVKYETGSDTIYNDPIKVNVRIRKYRNGTEMPVPGAVIGLFDEEGNAILGTDGEQIKGTTDEGGRVDFGDIEMGAYQYQELIAPEGYVRNEGMYRFVVDDKGNVTFGNETGIIYNARVTTPEAFIVTKYKINSTRPLSDAVIGLFDNEGNKLIEKTTGANGQADFGRIEVGNYYYQELIAPAGYVLNNTKYYFTVENNGSITLGEGTTKVIYDKPVIMKESFTIMKKRTGTEEKLIGAVIGIYNSDNTKVGELTTDRNGIVEVSGLEVGEYYYKELTPPVGYVLNDKEYHFTVQNDGSVTYAEETTKVIFNERVTTEENFVVTKYRTNTESPLAGAVIALFDGDGNKLQEKTTDANGQVDFGKLEVGSYYYQEQSAPAGYIKDSKEYHFTVENNGNVTYGEETTKVIFNERITTEENFIVTKYRTNTESPLAGAVIALFDGDGNKLQEKTTDANGQVDFGKLEVGSYYYQEQSAPAGYIKDGKEYHFTVENNGSITYAQGVDGIIYNTPVTTNVVITKYRVGTKMPLAGAIIGLFDANGHPILTNGEQIKGTTTEEGTVTIINLEPGTYGYQELQAPSGYVRNETMYRFTIANDGTVIFENDTKGIIYNTPVKSNVIITKYRAGTTTPLAGATIALFDVNGNKLDEKITGSNGIVLFNNLEVGTYQYKELIAPVGYILNSTMYQFTIGDDGTITYEENEGIIYNEPVRSNVVITKYRAGTTTPLAGAVIGLFDADGHPMLTNGEQIKGTTTVEGTLTIVNLEPGTYHYQELEAPTGYIRNETMYCFTIANDGTVTFENDTKGIIYNEPVRADVTITKYKTGTTTPVAGATIALFDKTGNKVEQEITNSDGQVTFTNLEVGNYRYQELTAPAGYILNSTVYEFSVNVDGSIDYGENNGNLYNDPVKADVTIIKYRTESTTPLAGATIGLFNESGNKLQEKVTSDDGTVLFGNLEVGTYQYQETQAPIGYVLNNDIYTFTVNVDGTITYGDNNGVIYNEPIKSGAVITKYITGTKEPVEGALIGLFDKEGNKLQEKTTTDNGTVLFENLEIGEYRYQELEAPAGYILNGSIYEFTINTDGSVTYGDNNGIIYNDTIKANIIITKRITGTQNTLAGAVIGLFDENGNKLGEKVTSDDGTVLFGNLEVGTYQYQELEAPLGYVLNDKTYIATVNLNGSVTYAENEGIIYNDLIQTDVTITKYITGTTIQVKGATIGLFDENGNKLDEKVTDTEGKVTFHGLTKGTYRYQELQAPAGYILNNANYTFTVNTNGSITYGDNNGIIYNDVITANVTITKYETGTNIKLQGATIGLFDTAGNKLLEAITTEEGTVTFRGLTKGNYYYQELQSPDGYILNDTKYTLTVDENGTVTYGQNNGNLYNDKIVIEEMKGNVTILKLENKTNKQLSGAVIGLFDKEGNKLDEKITDINGQATFTELKPGQYYYQELTAPEGYQLNNTMYQVMVNEDGSISYGENKGIIYNEKIIVEETKVDVVITKQDTKTKEVLAGAKIGLFDNKGNKITELETNKEGKVVLKELKPGTYTYKELEAPEGYQLNETAYQFIIDEKGNVKFESEEGILYNEKIVKPEEPTKPEEPIKPVEPVKPEPPKDKPIIDNLPSFLPQTGEQIVIIILITMAMTSATYYGMKLYKQKKQ